MFSERLSRNLRFIAVDGSEENSHIPAPIWLHQSHISAEFASRQCDAMIGRRDGAYGPLNISGVTRQLMATPAE
jgi:hypothetical protein